MRKLELLSNIKEPLAFKTFPSTVCRLPTLMTHAIHLFLPLLTDFHKYQNLPFRLSAWLYSMSSHGGAKFTIWFIRRLYVVGFVSFVPNIKLCAVAGAPWMCKRHEEYFTYNLIRFQSVGMELFNYEEYILLYKISMTLSYVDLVKINIW